VWTDSPAQGPAHIRAKSTKQKSSLLFITVYTHLGERVQSFKEKREARDMKYSTGVANDTKQFSQWFLVCRQIILCHPSSFLQEAEKNVVDL